MTQPTVTHGIKTFRQDVPALYGDHHVVEVRRVLFALPGVKDVYASSAFRVVEVDYDPEQVSDAAIGEALLQAGYLGELPVPAESGTAQVRSAESGRGDFFRKTATYEQTRQAVSFGQAVISAGRPLWPCPGMGVVVGKKMEE